MKLERRPHKEEGKIGEGKAHGSRKEAMGSEER